MLEIVLRTECHPTEDREKIVSAIKSLFPDAKAEGEGTITAVSSSIETFADLLKQFRIRDAARGVMWRGIHGNSTRFRLNKQVAAVGKISFSEERHPLGDIEVEIASDDIQRLIDSIAPKTRRPER